MPKSTKTPPQPAKRAAAKSSARNTDSGPSHITSAAFDAPSKKMAQVQEQEQVVKYPFLQEVVVI